MTNRSFFFTIALLFCTTIARAQYNQVNDIPYRDAAQGYAQERCKLDVYYPTNAQDAPVVVWFHGGGIEGGEGIGDGYSTDRFILAGSHAGEAMEVF